MDMPKDNAILLSVVNTKLRDFYKNLDDLCKDLDWDRAELEDRLKSIEYVYNEERNQFI